MNFIVRVCMSSIEGSRCERDLRGTIFEILPFLRHRNSEGSKLEHRREYWDAHRAHLRCTLKVHIECPHWISTLNVLWICTGKHLANWKLNIQIRRERASEWSSVWSFFWYNSALMVPLMNRALWIGTFSSTESVHLPSGLLADWKFGRFDDVKSDWST